MNKEIEIKKEPTEIQKSTGAVETATPFRLVRKFAEDMERLFEDFQGFRVGSFLGREFFPFTKELEHVDWVPRIEVLKHNGELTVRADLPGMTKENVKVEVTDEALTLSGERKEEKEEKRAGYYRTERNYGSFYRRIPLPEGTNTDKAVATFKNGVLEVTMQVPKTVPRIRQVEIKEGEKEIAKAKAAT